MESLRVDLAAVGSGLEHAREETSAADHAAEQIAAWAAGSGFTGIAESMAGVRAGIQEVGTGIGAVAAQVGETVVATSATPGQSTPEDAIASLVASMEMLDRVHRGIGNVMRTLDRAKQLVEVALKGGQPGPLRARLDVVRQTLLTVVTHLNEAKRHTDEAVAQARATGEAGNCARVTRSRTTDPRHPHLRRTLPTGAARHTSPCGWTGSAACSRNGSGRRTKRRATWSPARP